MRQGPAGSSRIRSTRSSTKVSETGPRDPKDPTDPSGHQVGRWLDGSRRPVHTRGRFGRLWGGLADYAQNGWWGIVAPRVSESRPLVISQAVILRSAAGSPNQSDDGETRTLPLEVLLSLRSDLFGWELPGGTPEEDEEAEETLLREVREETGFEVAVDRHVGDWTRTGFRPHIARVYRCRVVAGQLTPSSETPRVGWFSVDALPDGFFPWYLAPLARALPGTAEPVVMSESQGLRTIWQAMKIDLGMRWRGLPAQSE
jgi:8-oxo-dGTP diphosphatase